MRELPNACECPGCCNVPTAILTRADGSKVAVCAECCTDDVLDSGEFIDSTAY